MKKLLVTALLVTGLAFGAEEPEKKPETRSTEKRATIVGTAAAAGAAVGAAVAKDNRTKGALIGAAVGGVAGLIIDHMTKKKGGETEAPAPAAEPKQLNELTEMLNKLTEAQSR